MTALTPASRGDEWSCPLVAHGDCFPPDDIDRIRLPPPDMKRAVPVFRVSEGVTHCPWCSLPRNAPWRDTSHDALAQGELRVDLEASGWVSVATAELLAALALPVAAVAVVELVLSFVCDSWRAGDLVDAQRFDRAWAWALIQRRATTEEAGAYVRAKSRHIASERAARVHREVSPSSGSDAARAASDREYAPAMGELATASASGSAPGGVVDRDAHWVVRDYCEPALRRRIVTERELARRRSTLCLGLLYKAGRPIQHVSRPTPDAWLPAEVPK